MRSRRNAGSWLLATREKTRAEGTGVEILATGIDPKGSPEIGTPALGSTSQSTDWSFSASRIKALWCLHCCALPVFGWGGAGVPGNPFSAGEEQECRCLHEFHACWVKHAGHSRRLR
jgi:hypothetical protein